jgi:hypothetical protein
MQVAKRELALECDYSWEFAGQSRFKQLIEEDHQLRGLVSSRLMMHWVCTRAAAQPERPCSQPEAAVFGTAATD